MKSSKDSDPVEWVRKRWNEQGLPEPGAFAAVGALMRAHKLIATSFEGSLRPHKLTRSAYLVMITLMLSPDGARPLSYLSRYLMVHQTTITLLADQLEKRRLIKRVPHPTDRRTTLAVLTAAGRKLVERATEDLAATKFGLGRTAERSVAALTKSLGDVRRAVGDAQDSKV